MVYASAGKHVFVVNGDSGTLTVIDPRTDSAMATVQVGGKLESAVDGGDGKLYVNGAERQQIVRVDTRTNQVDARWSIPNCSKPHGLAIDTASGRLFASCVNSTLVVVSTDTGAIVATLPIGRGSDAAAFDSKRKLVFSSNGQYGTLSIIQGKDAQTFVSLGGVVTAPTARTMSVDPDTGRNYLVAAELDAAAAAAGSDRAGHKSIVPESLKLLFLDPRPGF